ncbi:MAG: SulP family inorganic anion transporter [Firmicutes bacterium]|nr:SulP family inorganic anion transporter [Bacillota bacterium]
MTKSWGHLRGDIMGGVTAAIVALPLGLAFGIASGAGAVAGLYASVFGGFIAALFGGCDVQITGPTGAMTIVLAGVVKQHGVGAMLLVGAIAGLMQVSFGLLRLGRFVNYLPQPVISGFANGVSVLFFMTAVGDAVNAIPITVITVIAMVISMRFFKKMPESLVGLVFGLVANELFIHSPFTVNNLPFGIPKLMLSAMPFDRLGYLIAPAFSIFMLGSISALLSAKVTDDLLGVEHNSNRELIGQGLGNITSSLLGGIPVSGAVARSGANVYSGGRTRLSGVLHAFFLLLMILAFKPVVIRIPLASLAAILMVASVRTADWKSIKLIPSARFSYGLIIAVTTVCTVVKDLTVAVIVGVALSAIIALIELIFLPNSKKKLKQDAKRADFITNCNVDVISFHGPLFFTGIENMKQRIASLFEKSILVLDFSKVPVIDETGAFALRDLIKDLEDKGKMVYIGGIGHTPMKMLNRMGIADKCGNAKFYSKIESAVKKASKKANKHSCFHCVPETAGST